MRKPAAIAVAVVIALVLSACGAKSEDVDPTTESFSVALDWYPNPDHAGLLVAQDAGYFKDAGLDVSLDAPSDPSLPIKLVAAGKVDLALSYEPEVLLAREQGLDVVAVGAVVNRPLTSMIWLKKSKIKRVADLKGKTVSTAGIAYQQAYLKTILARAGLSENDVKQVSVSQGLVPSIVSGSAQATLGPFWNIEGIDLKMSGQKPVVSPVDKLGVPTYDELVLVARGETVRDDPDSIRHSSRPKTDEDADHVRVPRLPFRRPDGRTVRDLAPTSRRNAGPAVRGRSRPPELRSGPASGRGPPAIPQTPSGRPRPPRASPSPRRTRTPRPSRPCRPGSPPGPSSPPWAPSICRRYSS